MASGSTHDLSTIALAIALSPVNLSLAIGVAAGGLLFSPDMDHPAAKPTRRWGPLRFYWHPFQQLFPHRGRAFLGRGPSHIPILGLGLRLLWCAPLLLLLWAATGYLLPIPVLLGMLAADGLHLLFDWLG